MNQWLPYLTDMHGSNSILHDYNLVGSYMCPLHKSTEEECIKNLEWCKISCYNLERMVDSLSWFVGGNETQIRELQRKLNELGIQGSKGRLEEDGVYGKETQSAWLSFLNRFEHGVFPVLKWGDPLQSKFTGIETTYKLTKNGAKFSQFSPAGSKLPLFRVDLHAYGKIKEYYHINVKTLPNASKLQKTVASKLDHFQISKNAYDLLKNFDKVSKFIHVAGKVLLVGGLTLDVLELGLSIYDDLSDPDKKLGKKLFQLLQVSEDDG